MPIVVSQNTDSPSRYSVFDLMVRDAAEPSFFCTFVVFLAGLLGREFSLFLAHGIILSFQFTGGWIQGQHL